MPVSRKAHQTQLPATPLVRTMLVTRFGVSVLNVVATIDTPMSHHGADRPDVKNSAVLDPARRANTTAGMNDTTIDAATIHQSSCVRRIVTEGDVKPASMTKCYPDAPDRTISRIVRWSGCLVI